jgi:PhnB protein
VPAPHAQSSADDPFALRKSVMLGRWARRCNASRKRSDNEQETAMNAKVDPIPEGRHGVTPYMTVAGGAAAIEFYTKVFGATEVFRLDAPGGRVGHAELSIGGNVVYLSDEFPEMDVRGPLSVGGTPVTLHLYVEDVDAVAQRAVDEGATLVRPVADQFYGDRGGKVRDPFGHLWWIATHIEDVSPEEMRVRAENLFGGAG